MLKNDTDTEIISTATQRCSLSVIIVNYNVRYFLEQALLSVRKAIRQVDAEVFVVDNNSVDDSVAMVREKFPEVRLIVNTKNTGFSVANNQAIAQAAGEYILLLNPDTVVEEDTFKKCLQFMDAHPDAGGLGVKMIDGSGAFLPESKRGFPSPFVAFCKTFGLSRLFPKSPRFNRYHMGHLSADETSEVDVLAGAFMWLRKSVLEEVGWLDENFFMYGEDIDLSYRIVKAGYKNYYFADTTIIHYKGESTKKGSLNYVKTFYNAMIIFAKKHFQGKGAFLYIMMLQFAIYFRAGLSLLGGLLRNWSLPFLDAGLIALGLYFLKDFWGSYQFNEPEYYPPSFMYFNVPLYTVMWLGSAYLSGGYDRPLSMRKMVRGLLVGTLLIAAIYGFLAQEHRTSRMLIILGTIWTIAATISLRALLHFFKFRNFNVGENRQHNLVVVGSKTETARVMQLMQQAGVQKNLIGIVSPDTTGQPEIYLSSLHQLDEVVRIYRVDELIFCSKDISAQDIMRWMTKLGSEIQYKILPEESLSIIGSHSKNSAGELYTIDIQFAISSSMSRRNKRLLDVLLSILFLILSPLMLWVQSKPFGFINNIFQVLVGKKSWVGYYPEVSALKNLPSLRSGVLHPASMVKNVALNEHTLRRLNFLYAKDYTTGRDWEIVVGAWRRLGE